MKHKHVITIHLPKGRSSFVDYEDQEKLNLTDDVIESNKHPDGACILVVSTFDAMLRFRLEKEIPAAVVFPHHFSKQQLGKDRAALLAHYGVAETDTMEDALIKMTEAHGHYRFHPHTF